MAQPLLLTHVSQGMASTLAFDDAARSVLWVCPRSVEDPQLAVASVELQEGDVTLRPAHGYQLGTSTGDTVEGASLSACAEDVFSIASDHDGSTSSLFVRRSDSGCRAFSKFGFSCDVQLLIGRDPSAALCYESRFVSERHALLCLTGEQFSIRDLGSSSGTFVNGHLATSEDEVVLAPGDIVTIMDLTLMVGHRFVSMNCPGGLTFADVAGMTLIDHEAFKRMCPPASETTGHMEPFYPAPRLMHSIHPRAFQVDDPPQAKKPDEQPAILQVGPQFLMGFASVFMATSSIQQLLGGADALSTMPTLAMSASMVGGMVVFPIILKRYQKKADASIELRRESAYTDYLNGIEATLTDECETQAQILRDNRTPMPELLDEVWQLSPSLMNRTLVHDDFMDLRVGTGATELRADVKWPQKRFTIEDDKLIDKVDALRKNPPDVEEVPLAFNPVEHYVAGILGPRLEVWEFARGLIAQICGMFGYQEVKLVLVADPDEKAEWGFLRSMPHLFDDAGVERAIVVDYDSLMEVGMRLERVLEPRLDAKGATPADFGTYYVIMCANKELCERSETIGKLSKLRENKGFSLVFFGQELRDLPRECGYVIDLTADDGLALLGGTDALAQHGNTPASKRRETGSACMFDRNDVSGTLVRFEPDIKLDVPTANALARQLARLRLDVASQRSQLPTSLGFLQMEEVGNTAQLNIAQRWQENDASRSLATSVGRDAQGEPSILNLHENVHGPHGLIAGTTGSGKSEFIITYILSLCVDYAPDEVAFVLIDYKGGGLAGAFDNDRFVLPHLAGTITNLDGAAITRSLVSIKSELKRRQDLFNRARDITGEATVDIYKYLSYYRQGTLTEPLPHLFIVADEFAELKQQEPEFMDELISAARIGRSLGVHLILATQKPSGVVNDQIWSNSRFKVCLKVADAADSKEMIRRPDAAEIKGPGRFYMLVGFNEFFTCGQSAYSGSKYAPTDAYEPPRDNAVDLIDETGATVASLRPPVRATKTKDSELNAVLQSICAASEATGKRAGRLWLNPLPDRIVLAELEQRYASQEVEGALRCVVGELDDPESQRQSLYDIDIAEAGNVMLYGGQASGVDALLGTMLYSLCEQYGPDQLAIYVVDLGTGALTMFHELPQCGGVVLSGDDERVANLIKLVEGQMASRRTLFASAGGDIDAYNRLCEESERVPRIVVALTNLAAFYELYADYEERLNAIARDAPRYGIHLLVTAAAAMTPRMRLKASFSDYLVTAFNDQNDYVSLLGSMRGVVAPRQDKRGLIKVGKAIREFQGASISESAETERVAVEALARSWEERTQLRANPIPVLPARVHLAAMDLAHGPATSVAVGFSKASVAPAYFDLAKSPSMLVFGNDIDSIARYLRGLREALAAAEEQGTTYWFIDPQKVMESTGDIHVLQSDSAVITVLSGIVRNAKPCDVLVFTSIAQTIAGLPPEAANPLKEYLAQEKGVGHTHLIAASEMWRVRGLYDEWFKVLSAYGNGVWVGSGFGDQSVFKFSHSQPEYRQPAARSDGFICERGIVDAVRLLEASDEPDDATLE